MRLPDNVLKGINAGRKEIAQGRFMTLDEFRDRRRVRLADVLDMLTESKSSLFLKYPIKSMALFGSYARNEAGWDSDIDILVEFSQSVDFEFVDLAIELESMLGKKIDLVSRNGVKPAIWPEKDLIYI